MISAFSVLPIGRGRRVATSSRKASRTDWGVEGGWGGKGQKPGIMRREEVGPDCCRSRKTVGGESRPSAIFQDIRRDVQSI